MEIYKLGRRGTMDASRAERLIHEILVDYGVNFKMEYIFPDLKSENGKPLRFDFVIFDDDGNIDFIIEYQGKQHYEASSKFGGKRGLYQQQHNDNKKRRFCALHGLKLIEIPYTEENLITYDYIMQKAGYYGGVDFCKTDKKQFIAKALILFLSVRLMKDQLIIVK